MDPDSTNPESCSTSKHSYSREVLLSLKDTPESQQFPEVNKGVPGYLFDKTEIRSNLMPSFMNNQNYGSTSNLLRKQLTARSSASEVFSKDRQEKIHVSLSLNKDVKLNETKNAWRPKQLRKANITKDDENVLDKEELYRKVRGILNKLTPENFEKLSEIIMNLEIDTSEKVNGVTKLVFEKAVNEPHFAESYARLCKRLENIKVKEEDLKKNFRYTLIQKTQTEFTNNVLNKAAKEKKLEPFLKELNECTDPDKIAELKGIYDEEERKIRRRLTGTVSFVGALFKNSLLTPNIINKCIASLLDPESEDKLECLCKLLTTVGSIFETREEKGKSYKLDAVIKKMQNLANKTTGHKISNRIRFMLQDVIDLRSSGWKSKNVGPKMMEEIEKATKADQLSNDLANAACVTDDKPNNFRNTPSRDNRNFRGFNNKQNDNNAWHTQVSKKTRAIDANKLGTMLTKAASSDSEPKLGNSSQFMWTRFTSGPSKSQQSQQTPSPTSKWNNPFAVLSAESSAKKVGKKANTQKKDLSDRPKFEDGYALLGSANSSRNNSQASSPRENVNIQECLKNPNRNSLPPKGQKQKSTDTQMSPKKGGNSKSPSPPKSPEKGNSLTTENNQLIVRAIEDMVEFAMDRKLDESVAAINTIPENIRWGVIFNILCEYIHLHKIKQSHRKILGKIVIFLLDKKMISMEDFRKAYNEFCQIIPDVVIDVPTAWNFVFQFLGPIIQKKILTISDLWNDSLKTANQGQNFVKELILHCLGEMGPTFTIDLWSSSGLEFSQFINSENVKNFIEKNQFQFIVDPNSQPPVPAKNRNITEIIDRLKELLDDGYSLDEVTDFLNGNVSDVDGTFIRLLTRTLLDFALQNGKSSIKLDQKRFHDICVPLLIRYIDTKEDRELECLFAVQILDNVLEHPAGLLNELFSVLYDAEVISLEAFSKWRESKEEPRGKGVAVKSLTTFFDSIASSDTSDGSN